MRNRFDNIAPTNWKYHFWKYLCPISTPMSEVKQKIAIILAKSTYTDIEIIMDLDNAQVQDFWADKGLIAEATTTNSVAGWTESNWNTNPYSYKVKLPKGDRVSFKLKAIGGWYILKILGNYELLEKVKYKDFFFEVYVDDVKKAHRSISALNEVDATEKVINKFIKERGVDKSKVRLRQLSYTNFMNSSQSFIE
jgi:hypothetical protein